MIRNEEVSVLQESRRNTRMAIDAIDTVLNKVYDEDLAYDLNCQANKFRELDRKIAAEMNFAATASGGITPEAFGSGKRYERVAGKNSAGEEEGGECRDDFHGIQISDGG